MHISRGGASRQINKLVFSCIYYAYFKGEGSGLLIHNAFFNVAIIIEEKSHQRYTQSAHFTLMCCRYQHVGKYNSFSHSKHRNASRETLQEKLCGLLIGNRNINRNRNRNKFTTQAIKDGQRTVVC